jgi:hypothetical protein
MLERPEISIDARYICRRSKILSYLHHSTFHISRERKGVMSHKTGRSCLRYVFIGA